MASSISSIHFNPKPTIQTPSQSQSFFSKSSLSFPTKHHPKFSDKNLVLSSSLSTTNDVVLTDSKTLQKNSDALWKRYVDWLYQHKELGLYLDVSRVRFTDEFVVEMEGRFKKAFRKMDELEKGAIANPDEGRMVGHYWLRKSNLAPKPSLRSEIDNTLESICAMFGSIRVITNLPLGY